MTPAEQFTAAAAALRDLSAAASPAPWNPLVVPEDRRAAIWCGPRENGYLTGSVLDINECDQCDIPSRADLDLMCALRPLAGPLADLFERLARLARLVEWDPDLANRVGTEEAAAVAAALRDGGEPDGPAG